MPNLSNPVYNIQDHHSEVQALGGNDVQVRNSPRDDHITLMRYYIHRYSVEDYEYAQVKTNPDMFVAEVAGLADNFRFKNQAERRHVVSAWYKKVNPSFSDKIKARNLYDPENEPSWWPKDVEYCSPTNKKRRGKGKLLDKELKDILICMRPVLHEVLNREYQSLPEQEYKRVEQMDLPPEVQDKLSKFVQPAEVPKLQKAKAKTLKQADKCAVVHQESEVNQINVLMPKTQEEYGGMGPGVGQPMLVPLDLKHEVKKELSVEQMGHPEYGGGPSTVYIGEQIEHAEEVFIYTTEPPPSPPVKPLVPTTVESFSEENQRSLIPMNEQTFATTPETKSDMGWFVSQSNTNLGPDAPLGYQCQTEDDIELIVKPSMLMDQTPTFNDVIMVDAALNTTEAMRPEAALPESRDRDWESSVLQGMGPVQSNVFMDTGGDASALGLLNQDVNMFSAAVGEGGSTAGLYAESSGFEISLTPVEEDMEISDFPGELYGINDTQPVSLSQLMQLM